MTEYSPRILSEQLDALHYLGGPAKRIAGEVLVEWGQSLIDSADRLAELQRVIEKITASHT